MRQSVLYLAFLSFLLLASRSLAEEDLFAGTPSPTPAFLSDHSYDNSDVDGTNLKPKENTESDDDNQISSDKTEENVKKDSSHDAAKSKPKKDDKGSSSDSREPDINGL